MLLQTRLWYDKQHCLKSNTHTDTLDFMELHLLLLLFSLLFSFFLTPSSVFLPCTLMSGISMNSRQKVVQRRVVAVSNKDIERPTMLEGKENSNVPVLLTSAPSFASGVLQLVLLQCVAGAFFGYGIGFVGPYYMFIKMSRDCSSITAESICASFVPGECIWRQNTCDFVQNKCSGLSHADCNAFDGQRTRQCHWSAKADMCLPNVGYTSLESGILAGGLIAGGCIGSFGAGFLLSALGRRRTFFLCGFVACVAAVLTHVSAYNNMYTIVISSRVLAGIASGILCVASPMYVEEMAPVQHRQLVGVFFQVACTFGILLAAVMGFALNPRDFSSNVYMQQRMQGLCVIPSILSALLVVTSTFIRESPRWVAQQHSAREETDHRHQKKSLLGSEVDDSDGFRSEMTESGAGGMLNGLGHTLFTSFIMCIAQQLTGIAAVMTYAPTIASVMGLAPLTGNLVVMTWNFATVLFSVPFSSRLRADYAYIAALFISSLSCTLTGLAVLPTVNLSEVTKRVMSSLGIAMFIAFFEIGMGSFFWILSQGIFPPSFRLRGSSFTVLVQFVLNIVVNVVFPIAVEQLSEGSSQNQDRGMGIAFLFFGCVGFASSAYLLKYLRLWELR